MKLLCLIIVCLLSACAPLPQQPGYTYTSKFAIDLSANMSPLTGLSGSVTPSWTTTAVPTMQTGVQK